MRGCIHSREFDESLVLLFPDPTEADTVLQSITYALGMCPDPRIWPVLGHREGGTVMTYTSRDIKAFRTVIALFTYDGVTVYLDDLWGALPSDEEEG